MSAKQPVVKVSGGMLRGREALTYEGQRYWCFQGVPYAKPPLGNLRFKVHTCVGYTDYMDSFVHNESKGKGEKYFITLPMAPVPSEKWAGIRDAIVEGPNCHAKALFSGSFAGSEDCLYLNVYTPRIKTKEKLPVMFWIHGGGFCRGSGSTDLFGPDYLIENNVILVTTNYRLGVLGFLAFSNPEVGVPGNAGLKDIVMALKWVRDNIKFFGGDPRNVTIFGESAGAVSVHLLMLSPMAKGLFHKAIMQSGCALSSFGKGKLSCVYELAHHLGIDSHNDKLILSELQKVSIDELCEASDKIWDPYLVSYARPFCPVIETKGGFLCEEPSYIMQSGKYNKVPVIMGFNSMEGIFLYTLMRGSDRNFLMDDTLVPITLNLRRGSPEHTKVAREVKEMYGIKGGESIHDMEAVNKAINVYTHSYFFADLYQAAQLLLQTSKHPLYFYRFELDTDLNYMKRFTQLKIKGACHGDELGYLFNTTLVPSPKEGTLEHRLVRKLTKLWTNFSRYGDPTPPGELEIETLWRRVNAGGIEFLNMENEEFRMEKGPEGAFAQFWERVFSENQVHLSKL